MNRISLTSGIRMLTLALSPFALLTPLMAGGCDGAEEPTGAAATALTAACVDSADPAPIGAWICGEDRLVECDSHEGAHVDQIYASLDVGSPLTCLSGTLTVSSPGPFLPGVHDIEVDVAAPGQPASELCHSTLTVVDTLPPVVTVHGSSLWPPNHKLHHIDVADCVTLEDTCDPSPKVWLTGASSDEPVDDLGDGNTDPDIQNLGCDGVDLRAERQGGGDGRVYTLSWHAEDSAGHALEGTCQVVVPHDQGGSAAVDSGGAYHTELAPDACH